MKFLFVKRRFAWPRASGHDVHTYQMMLHLQKQGHPISLLSLEPSDDKALEGLDLYWSRCGLDARQTNPLPADPQLGYWQRRFVSFWGLNPNWISATEEAVEASGADVVVVSVDLGQSEDGRNRRALRTNPLQADRSGLGRLAPRRGIRQVLDAFGFV
jgi:hypothetical protein